VAPIAIFRQKNVKSRAKEAMQPGFDFDPKAFPGEAPPRARVRLSLCAS